MKIYELESFFKSFFIFFILLEVLLAINFWYEYQVEKSETKDKIHIEMALCAYTLQCDRLDTDFVNKEEIKKKIYFMKKMGFTVITKSQPQINT